MTSRFGIRRPLLTMIDLGVMINAIALQSERPTKKKVKKKRVKIAKTAR